MAYLPKTWHELVRGLQMRATRNVPPHIAEDIAQQVMLDLIKYYQRNMVAEWEKLREIPWEEKLASPAWELAKAIARRRIVDYYRRRIIEQGGVAVERAANPVSPEYEAMVNEFRARFFDALRRVLSKDEYDVFIKRMRDRVGFAKIAAESGRNITAVRRSFQSASVKITRQFSDVPALAQLIDSMKRKRVS